MGVTIHWKLAQEDRHIKETLDRAEELVKNFKKEALEIQIDFRRVSDRDLFIYIGNCESLRFNFQPFSYWKDLNEKQKWNYEYATIQRMKGVFDITDERLLYGASFCKTQYAKSPLEHLYVAEIIRKVASYCLYAFVLDEGDYYNTSRIGDAIHAIEENGKLIAGLTGMLAGSFGLENVKVGGETKIKSTTKKKKNE
jgi:hypothetical protein